MESSRKKQIIKPKALEIGDVIGLVMPASQGSPESLEWIVHSLKTRGYIPKLASNAHKSHGYLAGADLARAQGLMELWLDPEVDALWCIRGGYGSARLLPLLDFQLIQNHPKMFIGMSDITALHIALGQCASLVSYLGPNLASLFHLEKPSTDFTFNHCWHFLSHPKDIYNYSYPKSQEISVIKEGEAEGILVGGNLALITSLIGTPWQLDAQGKILVLEDVNEAPYKIDRMLNQLQLSGLLDQVSGVVLGAFEQCVTPHKSLSLSEIFQEYFGHRSYPTLRGFPTGHVQDQVMLPLQCRARLSTDRASLTLLEAGAELVVNTPCSSGLE